MEMQGQLWLKEASDGAFINGKLKPGKQLPVALADIEFCKADSEGEVKLSLEQLFDVAHRLGDHRVSKIVEDISKVDAAGKTQSRWRAATAKRNTSILAHGVSPIRAEDFAAMKHIAAEFLGFELDAQVNLIPEFDIRWC